MQGFPNPSAFNLSFHLPSFPAGLSPKLSILSPGEDERNHTLAGGGGVGENGRDVHGFRGEERLPARRCIPPDVRICIEKREGGAESYSYFKQRLSSFALKTITRL